MDIAYNFEKSKDTDEIHIFQGTYSKLKVTYRQETKSICKKKDAIKAERIPDTECLNESQARYTAAHLGKTVCGICVKSLYKTEKD